LIKNKSEFLITDYTSLYFQSPKIHSNYINIPMKKEGLKQKNISGYSRKFPDSNL